MRERHVPNHGEAAPTVQLRGRQVREQQVPDHGEAARRVQLWRRQVREQHVPDHGEAALDVQLRERQVQDEAETQASDVCGLGEGPDADKAEETVPFT